MKFLRTLAWCFFHHPVRFVVLALHALTCPGCRWLSRHVLCPRGEWFADRASEGYETKKGLTFVGHDGEPLEVISLDEYKRRHGEDSIVEGVFPLEGTIGDKQDDEDPADWWKKEQQEEP